MSKDKFQDLIASEKLTLVDFFATWCGPCKTMSPILDQTKKLIGDKARIIKIDIDKNQSVAAKYQVRSVPTLILFKNGQPLWRKAGVVPAAELQRLIHESNKSL